MFDPGLRFWNADNVQLDSLRVAQSVIVGRAVILTQLMMPLPSPSTLNHKQEAKRFDWLLYGTPEEMYEIHGGCGFSRKLLHIISQITYCAARMQQDKDNPVIPMSAEYLKKELSEMRQWSSEDLRWSHIQKLPHIVETICGREGQGIRDAAQMTHVTAEAWRLSILIYLQCRLLR